MISDEQMEEALFVIRADPKTRRRWRLLALTCGRCGQMVAECFRTEPRTVVFPLADGAGWIELDGGEDLVEAVCQCGRHFLFTQFLRAWVQDDKKDMTVVPRGHERPPDALTGDALLEWVDDSSAARVRRHGKRRKPD